MGAALALLLYGCGFGAADGGGAFRVASRADYRNRGLEEDLLQRYRDAHPGLEVAARYTATDAGYRERLFAALAAGAPPDAFLLDEREVPALADGRLLDLSPYLQRVGVDLATFDSAALAPFRRGGAVYALPQGYTPVVLAYKRTCSIARGCPIPATTGPGTISCGSPISSRATGTATARSTSGAHRSSGGTRRGCRGSGRVVGTCSVPAGAGPADASTPRPRSARSAGTRPWRAGKRSRRGWQAGSTGAAATSAR